MVNLFYQKTHEKPTSLLSINRKSDDKISFVSLFRVRLIKIQNDCLIKQDIFGKECIETNPKPLVSISLWHELILEYVPKEIKMFLKI